MSLSLHVLFEKLTIFFLRTDTDLEPIDLRDLMFASSNHCILQISTGSSVLVQVKSASGEEFHSAIIADEDDGFFEIIFDDDSLGEEAEISPTRLTPLAADNAENHCEKHEASATEVNFTNCKTGPFLWIAVEISFFYFFLILNSFYSVASTR